MKWQKFEEHVRELAEHIWSTSCKPRNISGVDIDGVLETAPDINVLVEMTVRDSLDKVREDINKLVTAKNALSRDNIHARCYCVIQGNVTRAMADAGKPHGIMVLSLDNFARIFFDFTTYKNARERNAFGSAVNPLTGKKDDSEYVPVTYINLSKGSVITVEDISRQLVGGKHIVLLGEYGSGKSRCLKQIFKSLSDTAGSNYIYPMAIDLRESWGLIRGREILRRHVEDLGLEDKFQNSSIKALSSGTLCLLLDGFDELGSQSWSNDSDKLRFIRAKSLQGVKDLISNAKSGVFISGREHYFNNNEEMYSALGLDPDDTILLKCKDEFTAEETEAYLKRISAEIEIPSWLPRRPLICQTISDLSPEDLDEMFGVGGNEIEFFNHFIMVLCRRDANINAMFDAATIEKVLTNLASMTRSRAANTGPITLTDVQRCFEEVVGQMPVEDAAVMLQRLPALGRVKSESNDRQFIDTYILDGLRAKDIIQARRSGDIGIKRLTSAKFTNPLDDLGQDILAKDIAESQRSYIQLAQNLINHKNLVGACDIIASSLRCGEKQIDFGGIRIHDGLFLRFDMSETLPCGLSIDNSVFGSINLPSAPPPKTEIVDCLAEKVFGVGSAAGLPVWIKGLVADKYDSVESVSRIRQIGLKPAHEILVTIVRKTFFQKGSGRKEEALVRGLGQLDAPGTPEKILGILIKRDIVSRFKGDEGWVYKPNRSHAGRMKQMLYELKVSKDEIWTEVDAFNS